MSLRIIRLALLFLGFYFGSLLNAQTFSGVGGQILDFDKDNTPNIFPILVKGLPNKIDAHFGLEKVCIEINHKRAQDLKIELISPDGTSFWLSNRNGEENRYGYFNTCFTYKAFNGYIYDGKNSFDGEFYPEGRMDFVNNNQNPNGTWFLYVTDLKKDFIGKVMKINLSFGDKPATLLKTPCDKNTPEKCLTTDPKGKLLPDLIVVKDLTLKHIKYYGPNEKDTTYRNQLRFAAAMANIGQGPFEIRTSEMWKCGNTIVNRDDKCEDGTFPKAFVKQIIYKLKNDQIDSMVHSGGEIYYDNHPGHNHYHVNNWVDFVLLKKRWWKKNPLKWKIIAQSSKVSYCLFDNLYCDINNKYCNDNNITYSFDNLSNFGFGKFDSCNSAIQGISVGGIDYYGLNYEGQCINLPSNIKKGTYHLMIHIDPLSQYQEINKKNNIVVFKVKI